MAPWTLRRGRPKSRTSIVCARRSRSPASVGRSQLLTQVGSSCARNRVGASASEIEEKRVYCIRSISPTQVNAFGQVHSVCATYARNGRWLNCFGVSDRCALGLAAPRRQAALRLGARISSGGVLFAPLHLGLPFHCHDVITATVRRCGVN